MPELQVRKKDGVTEPFMRDKIYNGVVKSGGTPDQADKITADVEAWAPSVATDGVVNTSDIRVKVLEMLKIENPAAAEQYETYKKEAPVAEMPTEPAPTVETPMESAPSAPVDTTVPEMPTEPVPTPVIPPAVV